MNAEGSVPEIADGSVPESYSQPDLGFPDRVRLKSRAQYLAVQNHGRKIYSKHFLIFFCENAVGWTRIGITISKKVDKRAVARNRLRRRIRELFRLNANRLVSGLDLVVVARFNAAECSFENVESEVLGTLKRFKLLQT